MLLFSTSKWWYFLKNNWSLEMFFKVWTDQSHIWYDLINIKENVRNDDWGQQHKKIKCCFVDIMIIIDGQSKRLWWYERTRIHLPYLVAKINFGKYELFVSDDVATVMKKSSSIFAWQQTQLIAYVFRFFFSSVRIR